MSQFANAMVTVGKTSLRKFVQRKQHGRPRLNMLDVRTSLTAPLFSGSHFWVKTSEQAPQNKMSSILRPPQGTDHTNFSSGFLFE